MVKSQWIKSDDEIAESYFIRRKVFLDEQGLPEDYITDNHESFSDILLIYLEDQAVATGNIEEKESKCYLEKIAVLPNHRGNGFGDLIVRLLIRQAYENGFEKQYVESRLDMQSYYERFKFVPINEPFKKDEEEYILLEHIGDIGGACS